MDASNLTKKIYHWNFQIYIILLFLLNVICFTDISSHQCIQLSLHLTQNLEISYIGGAAGQWVRGPTWIKMFQIKLKIKKKKPKAVLTIPQILHQCQQHPNLHCNTIENLTVVLEYLDQLGQRGAWAPLPPYSPSHHLCFDDIMLHPLDLLWATLTIYYYLQGQLEPLFQRLVLRNLCELITRVPRLSIVCSVSFKMPVTEKRVCPNQLIPFPCVKPLVF